MPRRTKDSQTISSKQFVLCAIRTKQEQTALQSARLNRTTAHPGKELQCAAAGRGLRRAGACPPGSKGAEKSRGAIRAMPQCAWPGWPTRLLQDRDAASDTI